MYLGKVQMLCGRSAKALCKGPVAEVVRALSEGPQGGQSGLEQEEQCHKYGRRSQSVRESRQIMPSISDHFNFTQRKMGTIAGS